MEESVQPLRLGAPPRADADWRRVGVDVASHAQVLQMPAWLKKNWKNFQKNFEIEKVFEKKNFKFFQIFFKNKKKIKKIF